MKNTRKKMLLSSIAMLLVALIALGSATFAWYADVTTVTAETTTWNANTSSGLVIRHENDSFSGANAAQEKAWTTALNTTNQNALKTAQNLTPRALEFTTYTGAHGASGTAGDRTSSLVNSAGLQYIANPRGEAGYLVDHMFVAGEGSAENVKMYVTGTAATASSYLNLAVYVNGTLKKVFTSSTATTTKDLTISGTTATTGSNYTIVPFTGDPQLVDDNAFQVASKANQGTEIQIIAYVDGFNEMCKSDSVDVGNINVTYSFVKQ